MEVGKALEGGHPLGKLSSKAREVVVGPFGRRLSKHDGGDRLDPVRVGIDAVVGEREDESARVRD